jgi:tRNA-uridine 2-sulfurtransferase
MRKKKALVLLSGGLDSQIAVKILEEQNIKVEGICFISSFFGSEKAELAAKNLKIKLHIIDIGDEMLGLVKKPLSGYGKNMNPCIDCHAMMIRLAKKFGDNIYSSDKDIIIATGEVLGQRPFSQNKTSLKRVEKLSETEVLRPLSAKLLPETEYEKKGLVNRSKFLGINGRKREEQFKLARKYKIKDYPSPSGGCLLTDPGFSARLSSLLKEYPKCDEKDVEILKYGRMFKFKVGCSDKKKKGFAFIGRHEKDNKALIGLSRRKDAIIELEDKMPGPITLIRMSGFKQEIKDFEFSLKIPKNLNILELKLEKNKNLEEFFKKIALLSGWYAVKARGKNVNFQLRIKN